MTEIVSLADVVKDLGIPALFFLVLIYLGYKIVPTVIKSKQEAGERQRIADEKQQEYYNSRQKQYDEQMREFIRVAEQGVQTSARANTVIENVTEALKQGTVVNGKVIEAMDRNYSEIRDMRKSLEEHDKRAEKIQQDVIRIGERAG